MPRPRVVVKIGSSSITDADGSLSEHNLSRVVAQLAAAAASGRDPVLVTSGAIASGRGLVKSQPRQDLSDLQAWAAVGQGALMAKYAHAFAQHGINVGQVLLTQHDFGARDAFLNARNTLSRLLDWSVVPVINENDTVATDEISLGENDRLAALIAAMLKADLLLVLTDTPGVFSADPRLSAHASLIEEVTDVDAEFEAVAGKSQSGIGTGGMATKIAAAKLASWSGVPCVIAGSDEPDVVMRVINGEHVGTRIHPRSPALPARKVWIAFALRAGGRITVDDGAATAIARGGSLLGVGVTAVQGVFSTGAAIEIRNTEGGLIAKGLAKVGSERMNNADKANVEAVHRDDLVLLGGSSA